jgi:hypothetical protein
LVTVERGKSRLVAAVNAAGYNGTSDQTFCATANSIMRDPRVHAAIAEHCAGMTKTLGPKIYAAMERMLDDPDHPDHAKIIP